MRYGILVPNLGDCSSPKQLARLALEAESCGWDGFFIWDHILFSQTETIPVTDPWVALAAIAMNTKRIRIGPLVTPIARRRPWKLARETVSIDHLSGGRLVLGIGLGDPRDVEFEVFGEEYEDRKRAAKLDEGLEILVGLWRGEQFSYHGEYYEVRNVRFLPRPLQSPRIPIWVAGRWPRKRPFLRAARCDGVFPLGLSRGSNLNPGEVQEVATYIRKHRPDTSTYDIVATSGASGQMEPERIISAYADAGATWWLHDLRKWRDSLEELTSRIRRGPPKILSQDASSSLMSSAA